MVSAVITTYKREPSMLSRAIESVISQTYEDLELIVVDDSPAFFPLRKEVEETVCKYRKNNKGISVQYIAHETNRGACAARNTGIRNAKGDYIAFLDDDDEWLPEKTEKQMAVMRKTNAALVYCGRICKNDNTGNSCTEKVEYNRGKVFKSLLYQNFIGSTSFPLINTGVLREVDGFDELMQSAQDYDTWLRIAEDHEIDYVQEPLVVYHTHNGEQITNNPKKRIDGLERLNQKYEQYINSDAALWYRRHMIIAPYYAMNGDKDTAKKIWRECVKKCPWNIKDHIRYIRVIIRE